MTETEKTCRTCGETLPTSEFYAGRGSCKGCVKDRVKAHRDANLDAARDREREAARRKDHRAARRRWIEAHPEQAAAARRRWKAENREKLAQYEAKRRAQKAGSQVTPVSYEALRAAYSACYLCGEPLAGRVVHMDHVVPLSAGGAHTEANLRPVHVPCNLRKADLPLDSLAWWTDPLGVSGRLAARR